MEAGSLDTGLAGRRVVRRGLLAGIAGLGAAAMFKLTGTRSAEAVDGDNLRLGNTSSNIASSLTHVLANVASGPSFLVVSKPTLTYGVQNSAIHGETDKTSSGAAGLSGANSASSGFTVGVKGGTTSISGVAVSGVAGGMGSAIGQASGSGVFGATAAPSGRGVTGLHPNNGTGVIGISNKDFDFSAAGNGSGNGVHGISGTGTGVLGQSSQGVGLKGASANFVGLVGISDNSIGLYGYTVAPNVPAFYAEHLGPSGRIAASFYGDVRVQGNFTVTGGAKNAAVAMPDGSEALLYCQESPEPYFEDFGRARLVNGRARVQIEPEFASIIKRDDYMVFITPGGESRGHLFVSQQTPTAFEVGEANNGKSDIPFSYRIVARRKDIPGKRLERLDPGHKAAIASLRSQAASKQRSLRNNALVQPSETPLVSADPVLADTPPVPVPPETRR